MFGRTAVLRVMLAVVLFVMAGAPAVQAVTPAAPLAQDDHIAQIMEGDPFLSDDFSAATDTWGTTYDDTTASYFRDGALHVSIDTDNTVSWVDANVSLADFLAEVTLSQYTEPVTSQGGLIFRYVDDNNFYFFSISDDGYYRLDALVDDEWDTLIDWTESDLIETGDGATNLISVLAEGSQITLMVNDEIVDEFEDDTFTEGKIALAAGSYDTPGVDMAFDDFTLWQVGEEAVVEEPAIGVPGRRLPVEDKGDVFDRIDSIKADAPTYQDEFTRQTAGWDTESTDDVNFSYDDEMLHFQIIPDNTIHYVQPGDLFSDFLAEVDTTYVAGPDDAEYGIYFRNVDGSNYYFYAISPLGSFSLWKLVDNEWSSVLAWTDSDVLETGEGAENRLGVLAEGTSLTLLANDEVLSELEDDSFADGSLGLFVGSFDEGDVEVAFDNLAVWPLGSQEQGVDNGGDQEPGALTEDDVAALLLTTGTNEPIISDDFRRNTGVWDLEPTDSAEYALERRALHISVTEPNMLAWSLHETPVTDFVLQADVSAVSSPEDGHYGFVFRLTDSDNFYEFAISPRGTYSLWKKADGEWTALQDWTESDMIDTADDAVNRIGVVATGTNLAVTINDEIVTLTTDDAFADGQFGMLAGVYDEAGLEAVFDNVEMWSLEQ